MSPLVGIAVSLVPDLLKALSGTHASQVEAQAAAAVRSVTKTEAAEEAAKTIASDAAVKAELQIQLSRIAFDAQTAAYADLQAERDAERERNRMAIENTGSARRSMTELAAQSRILAWTPAILSYVVVVGFLLLLVLMSLGQVKMQVDNNAIFQIFNILIGALAAAFATVMNFWLGSSLGSLRKNEVIEAQAAQAGEQQSKPPPVAPPAGPAAPSDGTGKPTPPAGPAADAVGEAPIPLAPSVFGELVPTLVKPHRHFDLSVTWALKPDGVSIEGAAPMGTVGKPATVRTIWRQYGSFCAASAKKYGIPAELIVATIATESRGDANARRAEPRIGDQSVGLMQTLVKTAREATGRSSLKPDDLLDAATSIDAGSAYIAKQRSSTHLDPPLVAAAYNAGSIRLDDADKNRWKLRCHPRGTGEHVDRFVAFFCDAMRVSAADDWSVGDTPTFAGALRGVAKPPVVPGSGQAAAQAQGPASAGFPAPPSFRPLLDTADRQAKFGAFQFAPDPQPDNREHVKVLGGWAAENIVRVEIPIAGLLNKPGPFAMPFHKAAADQLRELWLEWEREGLLDRIVSFDGSYVPRFMRGSTKSLSNHAFGTAFDINAASNPLKARPAQMGERGCVRELVGIANKWGFFWGGHFQARLDGMHFEVAELKG